MSTVWNFIKGHWHTLLLVLLLGVAIIGGYLWVRRTTAAYVQATDELNTAHRIEIEKITEARELEAKEHAEALKKLQDSIAQIEADYTAAQAELKAKEKQARKDIVTKYGNDADGLAGLLSDRFGFSVVKPQ